MRRGPAVPTCPIDRTSVDPHLLGAFCATCLLVSVTPGLCSVLCLTLATTIGIRRSQWMMLGEVSGMGTVAAAAVLGVAAVLQMRPAVFAVLKALGGAYLVVVGWRAWRNAPMYGLASFAIPKTRVALAGLGYATAVSNPKVWALYLALLPPFIDPRLPLSGQLSAMLVVIIAIELSALYLYAFGGRLLARALDQETVRARIGRGIGLLMAGMGIWILCR